MLKPYPTWEQWKRDKSWQPSQWYDGIVARNATENEIPEYYCPDCDEPCNFDGRWSGINTLHCWTCDTEYEIETKGW